MKPSGATRLEILTRAEELFSLKGYAGTTTKEIAEVARVNTAMIHYYFGTKLSLFHAVLEGVIEDVTRLVDDVSPVEMTIEEKLEAFLNGYFQVVRKHPHFARLTKMAIGLTNDPQLESLIGGFFQPLFRAGTDFIEEGIREGRFRPVNPRTMILSMYCSMVSYFSDSTFLSMVTGDDPLSADALEQWRVAQVDIFFSALGATPPTRPENS